MGYRAAGTNLAHKLKSKRSAKIGVLILMGGMLALITEAQFEPRMVKVARVIDGDTIQVLSDGRQYTVRLIGADTPETKHPTEAVQRSGQEASAFTTAALEGRTVQLETDRTGDTVDRYGRLLRYVYLDGEDFNASLIRRGLAHAIRQFSYTRKQHYIALEEDARAKGRGLWSRR